MGKKFSLVTRMAPQIFRGRSVRHAFDSGREAITVGHRRRGRILCVHHLDELCMYCEQVNQFSTQEAEI